MEQQKYLTLIGKYLSGDISQAESSRLMEWVHRADSNQEFFDEMVQLWGISSEYEAPRIDVDTSRAWLDLDAKISEQETDASENGAKVRRLGSGRYRLLRYAAAILLLLAAGYWSFEQMWSTEQAATMVSLSTGAAEEKVVTLPDSSVVVLNERSSIAYATDFTEREVTLTGEAFFEVARDTLRPFIISLDKGSVRVLGTSFSVKAYAKDHKIETAVNTGKVAFVEPDHRAKSILIQPNEKLSYSKKDKAIHKETVDLTQNLAWMENKIVFQASSLEEIARELERYFDITITFENQALKRCSMTGTFDKNSYQDILNTLAMTRSEERRGG